MEKDLPRFHSILVPLDGSPFAEQALALADDIARGTGSSLRLALVHEGPVAAFDPASIQSLVALDLAGRKAERAYLRGVQNRLRAGGARVPSAVGLTGKPGPALADYAYEMGIDLVVMATHGLGGVQRAWLGSVADHLSRHLEVPLLLVRPQDGKTAPSEPPAQGSILVALDGSRLAEQVLEPAAGLARLWNAELLLVWVVRPTPLTLDPSMITPAGFDEQATATWRAQAQDYLNDIAERIRATGLRASAVASIGWSAAETIHSLATPEEVRLIALATHGRSGFRRLALGSVADKVIRGAEVPVLVLRPGRRTAVVDRVDARHGALPRRRTRVRR